MCVERGGVCVRGREFVRVIARLRVVVWFGRSRSALVRCVSVFVAPPARSLARLAGGRLVGSGVVSHIRLGVWFVRGSQKPNAGRAVV